MLCSFSCSFERCTVNCGTSSHTSKPQGLISANFSVCIPVIKFQTREFALRKHQYSASVCAKSDFPIVPKLNYMVQTCILFLLMYGKLGYKLTNVKTARINKLLIAFVHRITLRKHIYSATVYAKSVYSILPQLDYVVQFFLLFRTMYSKLRHKLAHVETARINKC
jgi:hypothetical protein